MEQTWIAIVMLASQLMGHSVLDKEFETQGKCWNYLLNHPNMQKMNNDIPTTRPVMLFKIQSMGLGWITCERRTKFNGVIINKPLANILLPIPHSDDSIQWKK